MTVDRKQCGVTPGKPGTWFVSSSGPNPFKPLVIVPALVSYKYCRTRTIENSGTLRLEGHDSGSLCN